MSDEVEAEVSEAPKEEKASGLRKQLEASLDENKTLKSKILSDSYGKLELDTTTGLGKAISQMYEGPADFDSLAKFAKEEYGYEPEALEEQHPEAQTIADGQKQLDQLGQTAGSVVAPNEGDVLAKAEADGDYKTTMAIKGQRVADSLLRR